MNFPVHINIKGKGSETLQKSTYLAAGGQGTVLQKGGTAYKIYHDPTKMIPVNKIEELLVLKALPNVLGPQDILLDGKGNTPIGFTMRYIQDTEFLCRLFSRNYRNDNSITPQMIVELIKNMQKTLIAIHKEGLLVVDFNEMNFLTDKDKYVTPYFIDVDSYQTPKHRATAIMESIRDRSIKNNQWTQGSDWFSFGVVAFQLYIGIHPYKGSHPSYAAKDWTKRMDDGISVFNKAVNLPGSCQPWDVIPKPHYEWFKRVFEDKERSAPPFADQIGAVGTTQPIYVSGNQQFDITLSKDFRQIVRAVYFFNGLRYVLTDSSVWDGTREVKLTHKYKRASLASSTIFSGGVGLPVLVVQEGHVTLFKDLKENTIGQIKSPDVMEYQGRIYTCSNGELIENTFYYTPAYLNNGSQVPDKYLHTPRMVCNIFESAAKFYKGVIVQDILGTCWLAIPYAAGKCANINVKELNGTRVVESRQEGGICIIVTEKGGRYDRYVLCFDPKFQSYTVRKEEDVDFDNINFTTMPNGVCISVLGDSKVEIFKDNSKVKQVGNPPFNSSMKLYNDGVVVYFVSHDKLHTVKMK